MLFTTRLVSSCCSGALTSDMALSIVEKTVNDSGVFDSKVAFNIVSVHAASFMFGFGSPSKQVFFLCLVLI